MEIIYKKLKYGTLKKDKETKEKLEKILSKYCNNLTLENIISCFYEIIESNLVKIENESELILFTICSLIIFREKNIAPLNFDEIYLAIRYFYKSIKFKKDKEFLAEQLIKSYIHELLISMDKKTKEIIKYLQINQGEIEEKIFIEKFNLSEEEFFKLIDFLEEYKLAKYTLGFKIKLDTLGKIVSKFI